MVGAITEIIVMSGLDKVIKIKADNPVILQLFRDGIAPEFKNDMKILGDAAKKAKEGVKMLEEAGWGG